MLVIVVTSGDHFEVYAKRKTLPIVDSPDVPLRSLQRRVIAGEKIKKIQLFLKDDSLYLAILADQHANGIGALRYVNLLRLFLLCYRF